MTADASAHRDRDDLFVADFYPQLGEYLAEQHAAGYEAVAGRTRFLAWLSEHAEAPSAADPVNATRSTRTRSTRTRSRST